MLEAAPAVGQVGGDPLGRGIQAQLAGTDRRRRCRSDYAHAAHRVWPSGLRRPANRLRRRADADSAVDTAASTPTVTVGPRNCERWRTSVRTERAPSGRALVASSGRDPTPGASSPARVSRTSRRWARAASAARHGRSPADNRCTSGTGVGRPNSQAAIADARAPSASACATCMTATAPRTVDARNAEHRREDVQPPRHPANVELVIGEADDGRQAAVPAAIGQVVTDHLLGRHRPPQPTADRSADIPSSSRILSSGTGVGPAGGLCSMACPQSAGSPSNA